MKLMSVLLVEDSPSIANLYQEFLYDGGYQLTHVETGKDAISHIQNRDTDIVLLDLNLPDISGLEVLRFIDEINAKCSVIVITAHGSIDVAVDSMQLGAFDFIVKPIEAKRLTVTVANAARLQRLTATVDRYKQSFDRDRFHGFVGASMAMQSVYHIIESAAQSKATVFIVGESGTGKEVCAEAIHAESQRKNKAFIPLNCGAIPKDLLESEIFGHVKGAFTGAHSARKGAASLADGGTLFLDEICELDLDLQVKLLRFIQTGTFQKVGGETLEKVDVRFVCATNREPLKEVNEGRFREDLYYRLHVIPIAMPPLSHRDQDVCDLANYLLTQYSGEEGKSFSSFSDEVESLFSKFNWPGNVRQLQNVIRQIVVLNSGETVVVDMLPDDLKLDKPILNIARIEMKGDIESSLPKETTKETSELDSGEVTLSQESGIRPLWLEEKDIIERAIVLCEDNIPKAAAFLDVSASTIYRKKLQWENQLRAH